MESVRLTLVELDFVQSSSYLGNVEKTVLGVEGTNSLLEKLEKFVREPFESFITNPSKYEIFTAYAGDTFRISFQNPRDAYGFVTRLGEKVEKYNAKDDIEKISFRIAAATGDVSFDSSKSDSDTKKIQGIMVCRRVARFRNVKEAGYFYVDQATFNGFTDDVKKNFSEVSVTTKPHEHDTHAWRYQVISDISTSTSQLSDRLGTFKFPNNEKKIRDELKELDESQIVEIARDIGIKEDSFPLQSVYDDRIKAINRLLDLADRRTILDELKSAIQELDYGNR